MAVVTPESVQFTHVVQINDGDDEGCIVIFLLEGGQWSEASQSSDEKVTATNMTVYSD